MVTPKGSGLVKHHSAIVYKYYMYTYGGTREYDYSSDLFQFDFESKVWTLIKHTAATSSNNNMVPLPRYFHMCWKIGNYMYISGGNIGEDYITRDNFNNTDM